MNRTRVPVLSIFLVLAFLCMDCGVASKTPFVHEENRITYDVVLGHWELMNNRNEFDDVPFSKDTLEQQIERVKKTSVLIVSRVKDRDYEFYACDDKDKCDIFSVRFIPRGLAVYASFRALTAGEPKTKIGKVYAPDLYGLVKIESANICVIQIRFMSGSRTIPTTRLLLTKEDNPGGVERILTSSPEQLLAEVERLNLWSETAILLHNRDRGACNPLFGNRPGFFISPGFSSGASFLSHDRTGATLGTELSVLYFYGGTIGFGPWAGGYVDTLYDTSTGSARSSIGPEIGWGPLGLDSGYVLDMKSGTVHHGIQFRGILSLAYIQPFIRVGYIQEYGPDVGGGLLLKFPLRLTDDAK